MALPDPRRLREYARKGADLVLRTMSQAPEQRVARDLAAQAAARVRREPVVPGGGKRVLIVTPRDWAAHVQYESVIAQALRVRGATVEFLTCGGELEVCDRANTYEAPPMPCTSCTRYVESSIDAHGFARRSLREMWAPDDPTPWPEIDATPVHELVDVVDDGIALGRLIDIPLKWFLCAADLEGDPLAGQTSRAFLRSARRIRVAAAKALDDVKPDVVLLVNGLFLFESVVWELARQRGIDVVTYERAFLPETLVFHRGAPAGFYDFSAEWPEAHRPLREDEDAELERYLSARRRGDAADQFWSFRPRSFDGGQGRLVALFTNLTWDTAVIGRDCAFPDIRAWLDAAVAAFAERPEHRLVIRIHPSEAHLPGKRTRDSLEAYLRRAHPEMPANVEVIASTDLTSSYPLMEACDVGLVYTSTTGLELALTGTPVVVAGTTHYRGKGFTVDVDTPDAFVAALDAALDDPAAFVPDRTLAREYAHFFFFRAPIPAPGVREPLPGLARVTVSDLDELEPGRKAALDRICDGILLGQNFVAG